MILYNVTVFIDEDVQQDWLDWMTNVHIPDVMATGMFEDNRVYRILNNPNEQGLTYSVQYTCASQEKYDQYVEQYAADLQADHTNRYAGKFQAFRTLMKLESRTDS